MKVSRRALFAGGVGSLVAHPLLSLGGRDQVTTGSLVLSSLVPVNRQAAQRLGSLCIDAMGVPAAAALVREQNDRVIAKPHNMQRNFVASLIAADYRDRRTVGIFGLHLSRLEAAILISSRLAEHPTPDIR